MMTAAPSLLLYVLGKNSAPCLLLNLRFFLFSTISSNLASSILTPFLIFINPLSTKNDKKRPSRSEEHTSELQSRFDLVCRLLLEKKKKKKTYETSITKKLTHEITMQYVITYTYI